MFMLLVVLFVLAVVLSVVVAVLVKGNASLKAQHRAYVAAVNTVLAEKQEAKCFRLHAEAFEFESLQKDEEIEKLKEKVVTLEKLAAEAKVELEEAATGEFVAKAELANAMSNYKKLEAYSVSCVKKSKDKKFDNCLFEDDYIMEVEKELGINWFK